VRCARCGGEVVGKAVEEMYSIVTGIPKFTSGAGRLHAWR